MGKKEKQQVKPSYYDKFTCIAGECSITCCKEWKIGVDDTTYEKWCTLGIEDQVINGDGFKIMKMDEHKNCPYLNERKLCNLYQQYGEEMLSKTCTTFPREIHEFKERTEYTLVSCCPEVIDMLRKESSFQMKFNHYEGDMLSKIRKYMIDVIQEENYPISKSLMILFYILLDVNGKELSETEWKLYKEDLNLSELSDAIDGMEFSELDSFDERNELFLDLAENYRKEQIYPGYLEPIAQLAEQYLETYEEDTMLDSFDQFEEQFVVYEPLFRNYVAAEIYNSILLPESTLTDMVVKMQWISMEYAIIKHAIFLKWMLGEKLLSYEMVRDYIVIISRMTGYEEADIHEYLNASFQSLIWEWGYLALMLGDR